MTYNLKLLKRSAQSRQAAACRGWRPPLAAAPTPQPTPSHHPLCIAPNMSILPSPAVRAMFPSKIAALEELGAYAEGRSVAPAGAALACPPLGFVLSNLALDASGAGAGAASGALKRPGVGAAVPGARKGAPTTARGFSGMAPAASGATVVKSTLKKAEEEEGGARVQIDHVVVMGTGPDDACNAFEANPFKPESAWRWPWGRDCEGGGGQVPCCSDPFAAMGSAQPLLNPSHHLTLPLHTPHPHTHTPTLHGSVQAVSKDEGKAQCQLINSNRTLLFPHAPPPLPSAPTRPAGPCAPPRALPPSPRA